MKVAFAGTPDFARVALSQLHAAGFQIPLVLTQPDRPAGRGLQLQASRSRRGHSSTSFRWPSLAACVSMADSATTPSERARALRAAEADVLVVAAYGLMLPAGCWRSLRWVASTFTRRCSPAGAVRRRSTGRSKPAMSRPESRSCRWMRGSTPAQCLRKDALPIQPDDSTATLQDRLAALGGVAVIRVMTDLARGDQLRPVPQPASRT
jgi:methionyl-tRNA formyltransferase